MESSLHPQSSGIVLKVPSKIRRSVQYPAYSPAPPRQLNTFIVKDSDTMTDKSWINPDGLDLDGDETPIEAQDPLQQASAVQMAAKISMSEMRKPIISAYAGPRN
ncbi:hypothetical protein DOTSEDRAFT_18888 [Dothistroma septosporum NZE10]|uniref:Uncharacterized protein n=1 Tax=Dothistroma septosporum (strain NZE10 / CBS 128990) TaxID=675120 RepID=N1PY29_DOTSN|nr:hypothetical protein DOTSEDRAFT_18888 [Dothistroma septosporum NZE10]